MNLIAYYVQRLVISRILRRVFKRGLIMVLRMRYGNFSKLVHDNTIRVKHLERHGYAALGRLLSDDDCSAMQRYLANRVMIDRRETGQTFDIRTVPAGVKLGNFTTDAVVNCPNVMKIANSPDILALAADYLGYKPTITNISLRWSFPTDVAAADIQQYHRDCEPASLKVMVYLTEVDLDSGPHVYLLGSHKDRRSFRLRSYSDHEILMKHGVGTVVTGLPGTAFVIDPLGIHKGDAPRGRARLLLCIQYSLIPALIYNIDPVQYHGDLTLDPYINRLMICSDRTAV